MRLVILDSNFENVYEINEIIELVWNDKYSECSDFELSVPMNDYVKTLGLRKNLMLLSTDVSDKFMIIENATISTDADGEATLELSGRSIESLLRRRIIYKHTVCKGNMLDSIEKLFNENIIAPTDADRKIENFRFIRSKNPLITSIKIDDQYLGESLYDIVEGICSENNIGMKLIVKDKHFEFSFFVGRDLSYNQQNEQRVLFSAQYGNLLDSTYKYSTEDESNVTLVGGEGEGASRKLLTVSRNDEKFTGWSRKEIFTDASGISSDAHGGVLSPADYEKQMRTQALDTFKENRRKSSYDGSVDKPSQTGVLDYEVGDIVDIENEFNMTGNVKITEITHSLDDSGYSVLPYFDEYDIDEHIQSIIPPTMTSNTAPHGWAFGRLVYGGIQFHTTINGLEVSTNDCRWTGGDASRYQYGAWIGYEHITAFKPISVSFKVFFSAKSHANKGYYTPKQVLIQVSDSRTTDEDDWVTIHTENIEWVDYDTNTTKLYHIPINMDKTMSCKALRLRTYENHGYNGVNAVGVDRLRIQGIPSSDPYWTLTTGNYFNLTSATSHQTEYDMTLNKIGGGNEITYPTNIWKLYRNDWGYLDSDSVIRYGCPTDCGFSSTIVFKKHNNVRPKRVKLLYWVRHANHSKGIIDITYKDSKLVDKLEFDITAAGYQTREFIIDSVNTNIESFTFSIINTGATTNLDPHMYTINITEWSEYMSDDISPSGESSKWNYNVGSYFNLTSIPPVDDPMYSITYTGSAGVSLCNPQNIWALFRSGISSGVYPYVDYFAKGQYSDLTIHFKQEAKVEFTKIRYYVFYSKMGSWTYDETLTVTFTDDTTVELNTTRIGKEAWEDLYLIGNFQNIEQKSVKSINIHVECLSERGRWHCAGFNPLEWKSYIEPIPIIESGYYLNLKDDYDKNQYVIGQETTGEGYVSGTKHTLYKIFTDNYPHDGYLWTNAINNQYVEITITFRIPLDITPLECEWGSVFGCREITLCCEIAYANGDRALITLVRKLLSSSEKTITIPDLYAKNRSGIKSIRFRVTNTTENDKYVRYISIMHFNITKWIRWIDK